MISIIIPFNNQKYLKKCISNIEKIDYKDYEIVLINDTKNEIKGCYKTNEETIGVGYARNLGVEKAKGDYIMFVDVDDTIDLQLLSKLQIYMDRNVEMIKYKMKIIDLEGKEYYPKQIDFTITDGQTAFNKLCFKDTMLDSPCLYLIKKELFKGTKIRFEKNMYHEDFGTIPQLIVNAQSVVGVDIYGYNYFQSENSIMRNKDYAKKIKKVQDKFEHLNNLLKRINKYNLNFETYNNLILYYANSILVSVEELERKERKMFEPEIKKIYKKVEFNNIKGKIKKTVLVNNVEMYYKLKNGIKIF